jgi:hypothetical protein
MNSILINFVFTPSVSKKIDINSISLDALEKQKFEVKKGYADYFIELKSKNKKIKVIIYSNGMINITKELKNDDMDAENLNKIFENAFLIVDEALKLDYLDKFYVYIKEKNVEYNDDLTKKILAKFLSIIQQNPTISKIEDPVKYLSFSIKKSNFFTTVV